MLHSELVKLGSCLEMGPEIVAIGRGTLSANLRSAVAEESSCSERISLGYPDDDEPTPSPKMVAQAKLGKDPSSQMDWTSSVQYGQAEFGPVWTSFAQSSTDQALSVHEFRNCSEIRPARKIWPTLWEICVSLTWRAHIEGSESEVAMNSKFVDVKRGRDTVTRIYHDAWCVPKSSEERQPDGRTESISFVALSQRRAPLQCTASIPCEMCYNLVTKTVLSRTVLASLRCPSAASSQLGS